MAETKRTKNIAFRLTDDEYAQVEKAALGAGDDPNTWCRKLALAQSSEGQTTFTKNERLIYQEIALLRFLIGHGFKLLFSRNEATAAAWKKFTAQADQQSDRIVEEVLSRRREVLQVKMSSLSTPDDISRFSANNAQSLMDVTQALKDTENSLRDFIALSLRNAFGENWIEKCGVSQERLDRWQSRKDEEAKRQESGVVEERLIYYADFYDIKTVLQKNWERVPELSAALGHWKTIEVWLSELERLRDPEAHRREILIHQKHLAVGIAGEIRTRLVRYRSKRETSEDYFPRIESVYDSLGNIWTPEKPREVKTKMTLRMGDRLDFVIKATDPFGEQLNYALIAKDRDRLWQASSHLSWQIGPDQVGRGVHAFLVIRSNREHHAYDFHDDEVVFTYDVIPAKS